MSEERLFLAKAGIPAPRCRESAVLPPSLRIMVNGRRCALADNPCPRHRLRARRWRRGGASIGAWMSPRSNAIAVPCRAALKRCMARPPTSWSNTATLKASPDEVPARIAALVARLTGASAPAPASTQTRRPPTERRPRTRRRASCLFRRIMMMPLQIAKGNQSCCLT